MFNRIRLNSIETRLIALLFLLTAVPAIVVGWVSHELLYGSVHIAGKGSTEKLLFDKGLLTAGTLIILFAFLPAVYLGRRIAKPFISLIAIARTVGHGKYEDLARLSEEYELTELTSAFNFMTHQLISARRQLERSSAELEDQKRLLRRIIDSDPNLIFIKDAEGRYLFVNEAVAKHYGRTTEDIVGKRNTDFVYVAEDALRYDEMNRQVLETLDEQSTLESAILEDGKRHYFQTIRKPLIWGDCSTTVLTIAMDVTGLKQTEHDLLAVQHDLGSTLDAIPDLLFETGLDGRYYKYHSPRTDLLAVPPEMLLGRLVSEVLPRDASAVCLAALREANENGFSSGRQFALQLESGLKWFELSIARKTGQVSDEPRFVVISRDITLRKEMEQHMQTLYTAIEHSPISVIITDADANIQYINPCFEKISGYTEAEVAGKNPRIFRSEQTPGHVFADMWSKITSGKVWHGELVNRTKSGEHYSEETHIAPVLDDSGKISQYVCLKIDNSQRKRAEMLLARSHDDLRRLSSYLENLRESERAKIARDLHDEMGSQLIALKMRVAWLASKLPADLPDLVEEAGRISALVADTIGAMHVIVNELRPNLDEGFGFTAAIEDYVNKFRRNTGIDCELSLPQQEVELHPARRVTLFRILQESLNNIARHARANKVKVGLSDGDKSLLLTVEDNGTGFNIAEQRSHSFGLLGIRERALMIGGKARVASIPGKGTRVSVTLPYLDATRSA